MLQYQYKTTPFKHQETAFQETSLLESYGLLWEPGVGKSKPTIDTAAYLFLNRKITALVIIAPNGVQRNWISDEIPAHLPDAVRENTLCFVYDPKKAGSVKHTRDREVLLKHNGLAVLAMSYNAAITVNGKKYLKEFLTKRHSLMVLDESHFIKTPGAKRTKSLIALGAYAKYRRVLTGTVATNGAFDVYSQIKFLDQTFWNRKGLSTFTAFKARFGEWFAHPLGFQELIKYRDLDILEKHLREISHRLTKEDAGLDLPPVLYAKRYFELSPAQRRAYEGLKAEYITELANGVVIEADSALVRLLRFQQITCNYVSPGQGLPVVQVSEDNPRLDLCMELCEGFSQQAIIWAHFREDVSQICKRLGKSAVRYDGQVDDDERAFNKAKFQAGDVQFFVGNPAAGGRGLTLVGAKNQIFYSYSFNLEHRIQAMARADRIGQDVSTTVWDLCALDTVDEHIIRCLRDKFEIAAIINGDMLRSWI